MATLEQIQAKMKRLQLQADAMISKKTQAALNQIQALMLKHGLTKDDIEAHHGAATGGTKRGPKPGAKRAGRSADTAVKKPGTSVKGKLPPKYVNHKTGETWSGHARPPAWIANVKDRTRFLIAGGANTTVAASADAVSKAKGATKKASAAAGTTAHKGQRKGP
jgi:DNA-binding protein H-NS